MRRQTAILFILLALAIPFAGAVFPGGKDAWPVGTEPDLNLTGVNLTNLTVPARYQATPAPVRLEVTEPDTLIPGPKGEMQAGPRAIGISGDPVTLAVAAAAVVIIAAGIWLLARRKPDEPGKEEEEDRKY